MTEQNNSEKEGLETARFSTGKVVGSNPVGPIILKLVHIVA